jgi:MFS family permease
VPETNLPASYRALLAVPSLARALAGMQIARIAQAMVGLALVLFTLSEYGSPELAGLVTFAGIAPGLLVSPIAGALLDRHGRTRLITLDLLIAAASLALIGVLALVDALPAWLLVAIAAVSSLTGPLSATGLRTLFPLMAPRHLWERVNAIDANGYVVASIVGPPAAAVMIGTLGGPVALIVMGAVTALGAAIVATVPDPKTEATTSGRLLLDAWQGLRYTWSNRTLRGLGFSVTTLNIGNGIQSIALPLIILTRLGLGPATVGIVYALNGVFGLVSGLLAGRLDTRGLERPLMAVPMLIVAAAMVLFIPDAGLVPLLIAMVVIGLVAGPMDVAMFTVRQRRTDPAWIGRAFAISMSFNFAGFPIGAAIGGFIAAQSLELAIGLAIAATVIAGIFAQVLIPERASET